MDGLNALEQELLDKLLAGDHPALMTLRTQAKTVRVIDREFSGVGFFCSLSVAPEAPRLEQRNFEIGDVDGVLEGLSHGAGFVLFVRGGRLEMLEGYSYDEPWPDVVGSFTLMYRREPRDLSFADPK